jgi:hypothetical protein
MFLQLGAVNNGAVNFTRLFHFSSTLEVASPEFPFRKEDR